MSSCELASLYTKRLQDSEIRLLQILPSDACQERFGNIDCQGHGCCIQCDNICCELITISLDGIEGRFDALSYSWGSSTGRDMIMINGANVPVTMNLNAALRRVRNTERTKLLWVDALCINQTDIDEKNVQVMRMKKIYTESSRVLVWLGDALVDEAKDGKHDVASSEFAMEFLKTIHRVAQGGDLKHERDPYQLFHKGIIPFIAPSHFGLPDIDEVHWWCLSTFLKRAWFSRVWVVQEIASAPEAVLMVGNDARIGWGQLTISALWMIHHDFADSVDGLYGLVNIQSIDACRRYKVTTLLRRMPPGPSFHSTLPHDKIFARLGMTIEGQDLSKYPRLRVDYGRDYKEVFRDAVKHCIEKEGSWGTTSTLHVLNLVHHNRNNDGSFTWTKDQSSWVPEWDQFEIGSPLAWTVFGYNLKTTKNTIAKIIDSGDSRLLSLRGIIVDKIEKTFTHLLDVDDTETSFSISVFSAVAALWNATLPDWEVACQNRGSYRADEFARIITKGGINRLENSESTAGMYLMAYWSLGVMEFKKREENEVKVKKENGQKENDEDEEEEQRKFELLYPSSPTGTDVRIWKEVKDDEPEIEAYVKMGVDFRVSVEAEKVLFITKKGYIGMGPGITSPGDDVCVLYGGKTPFIVQKAKCGADCPNWLEVEEEQTESSTESSLFRTNTPEESGAFATLGIPTMTSISLPQTNVYRLVGEAYVERLMDGEALDLRDAGQLREMVVHLV